MSTTIRMREKRDWMGRKRFVMDDTDTKPKTFYEQENEAICNFAIGWMKITALLALVVFLLLLTPPAFSEGSEYVRQFGRIGAAAYGGFLLFVGMNMPNFALLIIRGLALEFVTVGRK